MSDITREEAIERIQSIKSKVSLYVDVLALRMAEEALENQNTGHWIDDEFGSKCSCCGIHTHLDKFDRPMKFKHCSMCGAKMEGEQE